MKVVITESTHFNREVEVAPIAAQPGSYRLQFSSQLRSSRNPDEWKRNFDLILQRCELLRLKALLEAVL